MTGFRCRWHDDPGRCPEVVAAPGAPGVPELCPRHLAGVVAWARSRAAQATGAESWIEWAARRAADVEQDLRALGLIRAATPRQPESR
jgi:hypothetical protein